MDVGWAHGGLWEHLRGVPLFVGSVVQGGDAEGKVDVIRTSWKLGEAGASGRGCRIAESGEFSGRSSTVGGGHMCVCECCVCVGGGVGRMSGMSDEDTDHTGSCEARMWRSLDFKGNGVIDGF